MIGLKYLDTIKRFEGFAERSQWDYAQNTNGYGTRARYDGEKIDRTEAERRFQKEIADAYAAVERFAPGLDEGAKAALTSLTFNAGSAWTKSGLGEALQRGDMTSARQIFQLYNTAGGKILPGLVRRRIAEAEWFDHATSKMAGAQDVHAEHHSDIRDHQLSTTNIIPISVPHAAEHGEMALTAPKRMSPATLQHFSQKPNSTLTRASVEQPVVAHAALSTLLTNLSLSQRLVIALLDAEKKRSFGPSAATNAADARS